MEHIVCIPKMLTQLLMLRKHLKAEWIRVISFRKEVNYDNLAAPRAKAFLLKVPIQSRK